MANPAVVVDFVANTKDLQKGFQEASGKASGFGSKLKGLATAGAAAGFAALVATVKVGVDEFAEAQKVTAQTNAVLKSTGNVANVSANQVSDLAESLMKKSGVDDEAIASGENLLLTFTNVRNEAGKGNDVFNQTTKAALDMSVAMGTDMKSASMQLGKALNDPIKGVTKLTRSGVTFTDAQKKQITALVESGKTMEAQKIILGEVNKEFGGSAEAAGKTLPGQLNILKQEFSNLAGELVARVVPVLTDVAKFLNENRDAVIAVGAVLVTLVATTLLVSAATAAYNTVVTIAGGVAKLWAAAQWLVNIAMTANPIGLVVVAIAALVAAMVIAYKTSDTFRAAIDAAFQAVLDAAKAVFNWLKANWPLLLAILTGPMGVATLAIIRNWDTIKDAVGSAVNWVKNAVSNAWNAVKSATSATWAAISGAVSDAVSAIKSALSGVASWIATFASGALTTAVNKVKAIFGAIEDGAVAAVSGVKSALNGLLGWFGARLDDFRKAASDVASAIKSPINTFIDGWNAIKFSIGGWERTFKILGKKVTAKVPKVYFDLPHIDRLAQGGVIDRPTLAMVGEGRGAEIVTPEKLLREIVGERNIDVRVFIGDTELKGLVRTEIVDSNTGLARTLLAGAA